MKKLLLTTILVLSLVCGQCYADSDLAKWSIVNKSDVQVPQKDKIGNYYFDFIDYKTAYSTDGINYQLVPGIDISLGRAQYSNGIYIIYDHSAYSVPAHYVDKYIGMESKPMYIMDENLNVICELDGSWIREYMGYAEGYHYIQNKCGSSASGMYYTNIRSKDGIEWEEVQDSQSLYNTKMYDYMVDGAKLYDENIIYKPSSDEEILVTNGTERKILRENEEYLGAYWGYKDKGIFTFTIKVGEERVQWGDDKIGIESIEKEYLTLDYIYGIEMPERIENYNNYVFEHNGVLYFERDEDTYNCINKSELIGGIKVVLNDEVLAFTTRPTTENDRTLVPMRFLFEQMGAEVEWEEETQTAVVTKGDDVISFSIDNSDASINGELKTMDVPARLINDKTMIPVRFLSEELGCNVEWDEESNTVIITD